MDALPVDEQAPTDPPDSLPPANGSRPPGRTNLALAAAALALAIFGQFYFKNLKSILDGFVFFGAAIIVFIILAHVSEGASDRGSPARGRLRTGRVGEWWGRVVSRVRSEPARAALIVLSLLLSFAVLRLLRSQPPPQRYWDIFAIWLVSIFCFAAAFVRSPRTGGRDVPPERLYVAGISVWAWWRRFGLEAAGVLCLTLVALVLRFVDLGRIPNVVGGDEGRIGLLAVSAIRGEISDMFATTYGHSTMYLLIIGFFMKLFGTGMMGLRVTSALAGALTVPAVYLLARHMFNTRVALVASVLLTASHLHLHFSRVAVAGGIQDALFATIAFYFFLTGLERRSAMRLVISALVMGLHIYIYMGARLVILLAPVYVLALLAVEPKTVKENLYNLLAFVVALCIVAAPMGVWATAHPADFMARANQVGVIQSGWLAREAVKLNQSQQHILLNLLLQAFLTVNYYPATGFYNSPLPMLDPLSGAVFMLGIGYSLYRVFDRRHLLLQGWFWSGVVAGGALVVLPATAAYRILIVFPAVCIFVGLGVDRMIEFGLPSSSAPNRLLKAALIVVFLAVVSAANVRAYFVDYGPSCRYEDWGTRFASYMGEELGEVGPSYKAYLFGYPRIWYGIHPSVDYLSGGIPITDIKDPLKAPVRLIESGEKGIFFFTPERENELPLVEQAQPGGEVRRIYDCGKVMLTMYVVDE